MSLRLFLCEDYSDVGSVSYTHLDVYKRQLLIILPVRFLNRSWHHLSFISAFSISRRLKIKGIKVSLIAPMPPAKRQEQRHVYT